MLTIEWIRECIRDNEYRLYSRHRDQERKNGGLTLQDVETALSTGRILEQYEDTGRGKSCLVVGFADEGKPTHAVCGRIGTRLVIVTVYIPMPPKFKTPYTRGG